jgi:acylphosphatase
MPARRVLISGRVQGVGYRDWARQQALALGLSGWVRNLHDGRVEALAAGTEQALDRFAAAVRQGPRVACVSDVEQSAVEEAPFSGFEIRPTA